jgi:benzoyl-CoA reductase/2-hydroxyglutaryl-CoA dehydratase subunit BcrC/BadD/HgdB
MTQILNPINKSNETSKFRYEPFDPKYLTNMHDTCMSLSEYRKKNPVNKMDELYYHNIAQYYRHYRDADKNGRKRVVHSVMMPAEIIYALGMEPYQIEPGGGAVVNLNKLFEESFNVAAAFGFTPETCSIHRHFISAALKGWLPRPDAIVYSNMTCDNAAKIGEIAADIWKVPRFYADRGHDVTDHEVKYFAAELEDMTKFLENIAGHKIDHDRLVQAVTYARELMLYQREIHVYRKAVPCPIRSRVGMYMHVTNMLMSGTSRATDFFRLMRDEVKGKYERGEGAIPKEKYRLIMFFEPPIWAWKLMDWMEKEHGAILVQDPTFCQWGPGDFDPTKPYEALAKKCFIRPVSYTQGGPVELMVDEMVRAAKDYKADGVLNYSHMTCHQQMFALRLLKETLWKECGIPLFNMQLDLADPSFASYESLLEKLEGYFEQIDELRRARS